MTWNTDITLAPQDESKFLVKFPDGNVTTAYFYWYAENDFESFRPVGFWSLHDAIRDCPLDDCNPVEQLGLSWMLIP